MHHDPRREFRGRGPLVRTIFPWPFAALFGGVALFGAVKIVRQEWATGGAMRYVMFAAAALLVGGGVFLLRMAWRGYRDFSTRFDLQQKHPHEPWLWSTRPWDREKSVSVEAHHGEFRFDRFPYLLGGELTGSVSLSGALANATRLSLHLRHFEEEPVKSISGGRSLMTVYCAWEHSVEVMGTGSQPMSVRLPLPDDAALTSHFGPHSKYWVLDVESVPPGEARASFVLPVYPSPPA